MNEIELDDVLMKNIGAKFVGVFPPSTRRRSLLRQHVPALQAGPTLGGGVSEGRSRRVLRFDGSTAYVRRNRGLSTKEVDV